MSIQVAVRYLRTNLALTTQTETGNPLFDADTRLWHFCHGDRSLPVLLKGVFRGRSFSLRSPTSWKAIIFSPEIRNILSIPSNVPLNSNTVHYVKSTSTFFLEYLTECAFYVCKQQHFQYEMNQIWVFIKETIWFELPFTLSLASLKTMYK